MSDEKAASPAELRKLQKRLKLQKNKRTQLINLHEDQHSRERDLDKEREEGVRKASKRSSAGAAGRKKADADKPWSARMQEVRNRLDGKKRMATERWNRYAGTSDAGAMGR